MANGATNPHCGKRYGANAGGVGTHAPGSVPGGGETIASALSPCRESRIWAATDSPHSMPLFFAGPSAICPSVVVWRKSNDADADGNNAVSTSCAAALAAATRDALAATLPRTKYGSESRLMPLTASYMDA